MYVGGVFVAFCESDGVKIRLFLGARTHAMPPKGALHVFDVPLCAFFLGFLCTIRLLVGFEASGLRPLALVFSFFLFLYPPAGCESWPRKRQG